MAITEDDPRWDPRTMGNRKYGQGVTKSAASLGYKVVGKRQINKTSNERGGRSFVRVRRADGRIGHKYGSQPIVWLKPKKPISGP